MIHKELCTKIFLLTKKIINQLTFCNIKVVLGRAWDRCILYGGVELTGVYYWPLSNFRLEIKRWAKLCIFYRRSSKQNDNPNRALDFFLRMFHFKSSSEFHIMRNVTAKM